ncbi:hypothetical protein Avbf_00079 [Armadillidium vulgare]|nr:hypothetical protein Avbf_00079 [Armadillidium vulgare]
MFIGLKNKLKSFTRIKKLRPLEIFYEIGQRYGTLMTAYQVTLSSRERIRPDDVHLASLRKASIDKELHDMTHTPYDSSRGPLWRATFIETDSESKLPVPYLANEFPFQSQFIFGIHHAITDGYSNLKVLEFFVSILNQILLKESIEDYQFGFFTSGIQSLDLLERRRAELVSDPKQLEEIKEKVKEAFFNVNSLWLDSFGENKDVINETLHISKRLSEVTSQKFLKKLKSFRISLNSGMCALINVVLVEMMKEAGPERESYNIGTLHGVNMRQYWKDDYNIHLGLQIGMMRIFIDTSSKDPSDFWSYATRVNSILQAKVKSKWPLNEQIAQESFLNNDPEELQDLFKNENSPHTLLYTASSLGNVNKLVKFEDEFVQWTTLSRTTSAHYLSCPLSFNFQVFRRLLCYSVEYVTRFVSEEVAHKILNNIAQKISSLIDEESVA